MVKRQKVQVTNTATAELPTWLSPARRTSIIDLNRFHILREIFQIAYLTAANFFLFLQTKTEKQEATPTVPFLVAEINTDRKIHENHGPQNRTSAFAAAIMANGRLSAFVVFSACRAQDVQTATTRLSVLARHDDKSFLPLNEISELCEMRPKNKTNKKQQQNKNDPRPSPPVETETQYDRKMTQMCKHGTGGYTKLSVFTVFKVDYTKKE